MFIRLSLVFGAVFVSAFVFWMPKLLPWFFLLWLSFSAAILFGGVVFLFVCSLFFYGKKKLEKDNRFCRFLSYYTMDAILTLFRFRIRGEGLEKLPGEPFVLVCNHLSRFDPMVTFVLMKGHRLGFISKKENMKIPIVGPITSRIGFLPLDRENPLRAMRTVHLGAKLIREKGFTMGIYPEGTRSLDGKLLPFKPGAFVMAKKAEVPVVVCTVKGTLDYKKRWPLCSTEASFSVIQVIPAKEVREEKSEALAEKCYQMIQEAM